MRLIVTDPDRVAEDTIEFRRRLATAMNVMEDAARAVHHARLMSPTGEDLHLLRKVATTASELVADLHLIATTDWTS